MNNSPIPPSEDRILSHFLNETGKGLIDEDPKGSNDIKFLIAILGLIGIIGTEPYKILLRKKIGKFALNMPRLLLASVLYIIWGIILFFLSSKTSSYSDDSLFEPIMVSGGIFYSTFALLVIIQGIRGYIEAKNYFESNKNEVPLTYHFFRGYSRPFNYLHNKGWKYEAIWVQADGLFCLGVSVILFIIPSLFDPWFMLLGAPLVATSLSFIVNEWMQVNNIWGVRSKKFENETRKFEESRNEQSSNTPPPPASFGN